jgi:phenylacetate-coenzyme A ligase PaaK-like adenylate-forming protein
MADYEMLRERHRAELMANLPAHIERLDWSAEQIREERERGLRQLLQVCLDRSPWHRERLAGVDPRQIGLDALEALPVMTKEDLMGNWDRIVTDPRLSLEAVEEHLERVSGDAYLLDHFHAVASGGSSGRRGVFVYDWQAWMIGYLGFVRMGARERMLGSALAQTPLVAATVAADKATHMTSAFGQTFSSPLIPVHRLPITLPLGQIVEGLNAIQPSVLNGYTSALCLLAHEARAERLRIAPRSVIATSEPLLPEMRLLLEETWNAPVGNWWGTSEGGPTGLSCGQGPGMHLCEDLMIVEPVSEEGSPVPPGVRSEKVYLTNLYNRTLPLIRYELTDQVLILEDPCPCGCAHRRIADIEGRHDDAFVYQGGLTVHPITFRSPLGRQRNIVEYQVRQRPRGAEIAVRTMGPVSVRAIEREIEAGLSALGLRDPSVTILPVTHLDRQASGKLKRFVPLAPAPPDPSP